MKPTTEYLDELKNRYNLESDNALSKLLDTTRQAISNYRNRGQAFDDYTALKVANLLEINPLQVIADANAERAKHKREKEAWKTLIKKLQSAAMIAGVAVIVGMNPASIKYCNAAEVHCILCKIIKRLKKLIARNFLYKPTTVVGAPV